MQGEQPPDHERGHRPGHQGAQQHDGDPEHPLPGQVEAGAEAAVVGDRPARGDTGQRTRGQGGDRRARDRHEPPDDGGHGGENGGEQETGDGGAQGVHPVDVPRVRPGPVAGNFV
ncbi:Uncharacterised protein [Mycobacteroides abscessus subsp. abscessus]|nr:Uncharacterised protein [Mycobacteroides abscessus subsp. abscessus]